MPKKPARNAFYFFMKDLEPVLKREGRVFPNGMQDIVPIAHPRWKALPENEKNRYEKMAKEYKGKMRGVEGDKFRMDNVGNILAHRVDPMAEIEKQRLKERNQVKSKWPSGKDVKHESFCLINFQTLCKTEEGEYLPAEIAVVEYSLAKGITKNLHRFVEPGRIPLGYSYECRQKGEDYHKIPEQNFEHADANYRGLWIQLENFLNPNGEKPHYPPLYCMGNDVEETSCCLAWIHNRAVLGIPNRLKKVYELEGMVTDLIAHIGKQASKSSVMDMLSTSAWDYEPKTRCFFHEELECKYCALAIVKRLTYAISDSLCNMYEVPLTENHLPTKAESTCKVLPASTLTFQHQKSSRMASKQRHGAQWGQGKMQGGQRYTPTTTQAQQWKSNNQKEESSEEDSDDEVGYTSLRRPNAPVEGQGDPRVPWNAVPSRHNLPPTMTSHSDFPSLGRGVSMAPAPLGRGYVPVPGDFPAMGRGLPVQNVGIGRGQPMAAGIAGMQQKFAGRASAPAPSSAPVPPASWVQEPASKPTMTDVAQFLNDFNQSGPMSQAERNPPSQTENLFVPPSGQQTHNVPSSSPQMQSVSRLSNSTNSAFSSRTSAYSNGLYRSTQQTFMMDMAVGRGRGILGNIDPQVKVPKGRGYAPPGMDVQKHLQSLKLAQ